MLSHVEQGRLILLAALPRRYVGHLNIKATVHINTILYLERSIIKNNQYTIIRTGYSLLPLEALVLRGLPTPGMVFVDTMQTKPY